MPSDSDMATFFSDCECSMKDASHDCFLVFLFHVALEVHLLNLSFILALTVSQLV
jgi:hypothetical protein